MRLWDYILKIYDMGVEPPRVGGGLVGGLICYILQFIGGSAMCWVVLSIGLIICVVLLTRVSLRTLGEVFSANVKHVFERMDIQDDIEVEVPVRGRKLYVREIDEEVTKKAKPRPRRGRIPFDERFTVPDEDPEREKPDIDFIPQSGRLQMRDTATSQWTEVSEQWADAEFPLPDKKADVEKKADKKPKDELSTDHCPLPTDHSH